MPTAEQQQNINDIRQAGEVAQGGGQQTAATAAAPTAAQTAVSQLTQPGYLGAPAQVQAPQYDLATLLQGWAGPNQAIAELNQGFQPQAQSANNNLQQTLANFGITGGQAVGAESQLQGQLAASLAPTLGNLIGQSNSQWNSQLGSALGQNQQLGYGAATTNAGATNATNAANVGQYNQSQEQQLQDILNSYYAQMGQFGNINSSGQGAGNQQAIQYGGQITQSDPFGAIFGPLVGAAGQFGSAAVKAGAVA